MKTNRLSNRRLMGFTLVELLVVIAIISILVLMFLPAINAARESARRTGCMARISQIMLAVQSYQNTHEVYPTGVVEPSGPIVNVPIGNHHGWLIAVLPHIEEGNVYRQIDHTVSVYHRKNIIAAAYSPDFFTCPSSAEPESSYAGVHHDVEAPIDADNSGIFFLNSRISRRHIPDGISHTLFVGEVADHPKDLSWLSGTRATLRNTGTRLNLTGDAPTAISTVTEKMIVEFETNANERSTDFDTLDDEYDLDVEPEDELVDIEPNESRVGQTIKDDDAKPSKDNEPESETSTPVGPHATAKKNKTYVGGFGSDHSGAGAIFVFGDGHVKFITNSIDQNLYQQLGNRHDGSSIELDAIP